MSGGVDSSVAAVKLKQEGHEVVGVHMILWAEDIRNNKCCNTADMMFARQVADSYDIPFYTLDFNKVFKEKIVGDAFLSIYEEGRTPNPCVSCNRNIRFGALLDKARELGMDKVVTGHYAHIDKVDGVYKLRSGVDKSKDQSYFLHRVTQDKLKHMHFPLGNMTKKEVLELGKEWGVINENKVRRESQDLCFIPEKSPEPFLKRQLDQKHWKSGDMINASGEKLGEHRGLPFYTIGQRRGIELGGLEDPLYVIGKDEEENKLVLGSKDEGGVSKLKIRNLNLIDPNFDEAGDYDFRIRYGGSLLSGKLKRVGGSYSDDSGELHDAELELSEKAHGITPGQYVVIYDGDYCLGGGEII